MTTDEMRVRCAECLGLAGLFFLMKRGLYWRPNAKGYTSSVSEAWIISEAEADKYTYPYDEPVTKHPAPTPNYPSDLNSAIQLCDKLAEEGWRCEMNNGFDGTWECMFWRKADENTKRENMTTDEDDVELEKHYHSAETLAEVICGAFLRVRGVEIEREES